MNTMRVLLWASSIVLIYGSLRGESTIFSYLKLSDSLNILNQTVDKIENNILYLEDEIYKLENSPRYARKILRDKYHITEENENIIFFAD